MVYQLEKTKPLNQLVIEMLQIDPPRRIVTAHLVVKAWIMFGDKNLQPSDVGESIVTENAQPREQKVQELRRWLDCGVDRGENDTEPATRLLKECYWADQEIQ